MIRCRALVVLVLGCSFAVAAAGCASRGGKMQESRRLTAEGTAMRDAGWKSGDLEKLEEGQQLMDKGAELREQALEGT